MGRMSESLDNLCVLPHIGPEKQGILRENNYGSFEKIALATPLELHQNCQSIGLSETATIINEAISELDSPCPKCSHDELKPIWGGYPGDLSESDKSDNDLFCGNCLWFGDFSDASSDSKETQGASSYSGSSASDSDSSARQAYL